MEERVLGPSDLKVSALGLGCNNFGMKLDVEETRAVIDAAIDAGVTLFDTADIYGSGDSEAFMGEALGPRRKNIVLATKFAMVPGGSPRADRAYIGDAIDRSLTKLKTDWIDLYQVHCFDESTPVEETLEALNDLIKAGKVRHIGCSNFPAARVLEADDKAKARGWQGFISCQDEYSLIHRGIELDLLPAMRSRGLGLLPYFPLASGLLTGKYRRGETASPNDRLSGGRWASTLNEANFALVDRLSAYAEDRGHTLLQLAFGWLLAQPGMGSVIAGATSPAQIHGNAAAVAAWKLTAQESGEVAALLGPARPGGVFG